MSLQRLNLVDPDPWSIELPCIRARQPVGSLYVASIPYTTITKITFFDVRRVLRDERDVERYLGIQRPLISKRVSALEAYVNHYDASFPTAIILAIDDKYAVFDRKRRVLTLSNTAVGDENPSIVAAELARIIDGQHRIAGLANFKGVVFDVPVTILLGADIAEQAQMFATVNLEQTKVSKSLAYDLYELAQSRSPQKTCHNIAVALSLDEDSPFYKRIRRLGTASADRSFEPISQATFVEALLQYISPLPKEDRDILLRGKKLRYFHGEELDKFPLRNLFVDEDDIPIADIVFNYFSAVRRRWEPAWAARGRGLILNRTNGFRGLMRAFRHIYAQCGAPGDVVSANTFHDYFLSIKIRSQDFNTDNFAPGTSGESRLLRVFTKKERFQPDQEFL